MTTRNQSRSEGSSVPEKLQDLTGRKFGRLTVVEFSHRGPSGTYWHCICQCAATTVTRAYDLRNGRTKSCGCLNREPRSKYSADLTGRRYGTLTVLDFFHRGRNGRYYWRCLCDCGTILPVDACKLMTGHTKSCRGHRAKQVYVGLRINRLTVIKPSRRPKHREPSWACRCDCGKTTIVGAYHLLSGHTQSCGCSHRGNRGGGKRLHGLSGKTEYITWRGIRQRCYDRTHKNYHHYGGRGINMCHGWLNDVVAFCSDMGKRPSPEHSIDRKDNDGGYWCGHCEECVANSWPENCRWATRHEQARNRRNSRVNCSDCRKLETLLIHHISEAHGYDLRTSVKIYRLRMDLSRKQLS